MEDLFLGIWSHEYIKKSGFKQYLSRNKIAKEDVFMSYWCIVVVTFLSYVRIMQSQMHMRHQYGELSNFLHYKSFNHNIVIAMSLNHPTIGETKDDDFSFDEFSLIPKDTPSLIHLYS